MKAFTSKCVVIQVIPPEPHKPQTHKFRCHPGDHYEESHIQDLLWQVSNRVEVQFSKWEFRLVELKPDHFKYIFAGLKEPNLLHAGRQAAKILEEINNGKRPGTEATGVPIAQKSKSVEDHHDSERK